MPTYHYRCAACEQHIEVVHSMTDDPVTECGACGGQMQKVLRPVGIVLKGSGFYRTDNRSRSSAASRSESTSESKSERKTEKKADSKSDSTSDSKSDSKSASSAPKSEPKSA